MRNHVVVIGSGMMGSGIAAMAALAGHPVILTDVSPDIAAQGLEKAKACIDLRQENGLATAEEAYRAQTLLSTGVTEEALPHARLVIEAIIENLEIKQQLFAQLDAALPADVPICSNTSGLQITKIAALCTHHPERCVTTHFWLPAHLVPLVEVVMGDKTDLALAQSVVDELKTWKKSPVLVRRDLPGQLANRIFQAIIREAIDIVATGLATAEDVDAAISCGMAMRFPEWGPLKHLDAIGLELGLAVQDSVLPSINRDQQANDYLRSLIAQGHTGAKAGQGFYNWHEHSIDEAMAKRDAFIMEAVKVTSRLDNK